MTCSVHRKNENVAVNMDPWDAAFARYGPQDNLI
jgi:hypothetical protein